MHKFLRFCVLFIFIVTFAASVFFFVQKPRLHKPFEISVVDCLIKINKDGTYTKEIKTTTFKEAK